MSRILRERMRGIVPLAAVLMLCMSASAGATEFWLRAETTSQSMPDGRVVPMWGFALDADHNFTTFDGAVTIPGPALAIPPGEDLIVHLFNRNVPEGISLIIPGQAAPTDGIDPEPQVTRNQDGQGRWRATSFAHETPMGFQKDYVWSTIRAGTYLYQSGTHPAVQVQMGLYGAVVQDEAAGDAYGDPAAHYDQDLILLYGEIDPALHDAVAGGRYGVGRAVTSTIGYDPKYFLVNGLAYSPGRSSLPIGSGGKTLLRLLNAGLETHLPVLGGGPSLTLISEDGNLLPYPRLSPQVELPAGKTADAILDIDALAAGYYPLYDRKLALSNDKAPGGGMLVHLAVSSGPIATLTVAKNGTGSGTVVAGSAPGGISCGADCSEGLLAGTTVVLKGLPAPGSFLANWTGGGCSGMGDCVTTVNGSQTVTATFTRYTVVRVVTPNTTEHINEKSFYPIRWGAPVTARRFTVQYSTNGGLTWTTIAAGVEGTSLLWEVPQVSRTFTNCRVRVIGYTDRKVRVGSDISDRAFWIVNIP